MAISYISSSTKAQDSTASSIVVTAPANIQDGDILVCLCRTYRGAGSASISMPGGFSEIANAQPTTYRYYILGYKRASSESGNYTFTLGSSSYAVATISVFRGCLASGSPVDVYSNTAYVTSNTTMRAATVTTTVDNTMLWAAGAGADAPTSSLPPGGMTETADTYAMTMDCVITAAYVAQAAAGASGNKDFTLYVTTTNKHAFLVALKPALLSKVYFNFFGVLMAL